MHATLNQGLHSNKNSQKLMSEAHVKKRPTASVKDAARQIGVTLKNIYDLVWSGRLQAEKVDGVWRIDAESIEAPLNRRQ